MSDVVDEPRDGRASHRADDVLPPRHQSRNLRILTSDPTEAESLLTAAFRPVALRPARSGARFELDLVGQRWGAAVVGRFGIGRAIRLSTGELSDVVIVIPREGTATFQQGRASPVTRKAGEPVIFSSGASAQAMLSEGCTQTFAQVSRASLETQVQRLLGHPVTRPLRFQFAPEATARPEPWLSILGLLCSEPPEGLGGRLHAVLARHLGCLIRDGLLLTQPHNYSEDLHDLSRAAPRTLVRRAVQVIQERPSEPWTIATLAQEVHASVRSLQEGFSRDLGQPPMAYLRIVRLRRARESLAASTPGTTKVKEVAASLGFAHMGRFAAAYREAFGESPKETLQREVD